MAKYQYGSRRSLRKVMLAVAAVIIVALAGTAVIVQRTYVNNLKPLSASQKSVIFTVESGWSARQIADGLEQAGVIRKSWALQWYVRNGGYRDKLQAGTYSLRPSQSVQEIVDILTKGKVNTAQVTILPSKRLDQIEQSLINDGFAPDAVKAALDPSHYEGHPALVDKPSSASLEGYLFPETFQKTAATTPEDIVAASLDQMQLHLTPDLRRAFVKQGLTVHEGIILASIVEREVNSPQDRQKAAQVFLKRLRIGMPLQSDVTAAYGAVLDGKEPDIHYESGYNTFSHPGLPPGPISNVSQSSLEAVANPADTDFLFFVAGDDGITYFSKTNEEHEAQVEAHCKRLCSN